jgi:hypothetical protein
MRDVLGDESTRWWSLPAMSRFYHSASILKRLVYDTPAFGTASIVDTLPMDDLLYK